MRESFLDIVGRRVVVLDGAMGTSIHRYPLDLQRDWLGHENCSEILIETRADVIREIHESFLAAGSDAVETNTFGANRIVLGEFGIAEKTYELNKRAAEIAREACERFATAQKPRFVVGAAGPGTKLLTLAQTTWEAMEESYFEQFRGLLAGGVDVLLIETAQDLLQIKCAMAAAMRAMDEAKVKLPVMVQVSMDNNAGQSMLLGTDSTAVVAALLPYEQVVSLGLNCATGPAELSEHVQYMSQNWPRLISVQPNAGMPRMVEGHAHFPLGPSEFVKGMLRFVEEFGANIVGGCCGTTPEHIRALCEAIGSRAPRARQVFVRPAVSSLISATEIRQETSYLIIAERTNTNGSRQFKRLLQAEDWDGLVSMARDEMRDGSHVLDVCVDFVGRDGVRDMAEATKRFVNALAAPLMLDSTDPKVMEAGLKRAGGKCILNSMNLEDGEERVALICALAKKYGAAVVAGTIDEDKQNAMARTAERKLSIATRIRDLANTFGLRDEDILFDPLVLPISTGLEADRRNALETIEGVRRITQELPRCHTVVGLSNVSFGLKPSARVALNSAFLHELREAGLTAAIVHASKILPRNRIPAEQWEAALDLIYDRRREGFDPLTRFVSLFPEGEEKGTGGISSPTEEENLPIEEVLKRHIVVGEKRNLGEHLDEAMKTYRPLQIINDILLAGMKIVGELFGSGQMQLPFVLQSAETMKAAVAHLEPFMEKVEGTSKGRIVLATVKGDVHDIGKNLVDIILSNNGYTVINLGIKQPIADILKAATEKRADAIGMSGLLVKSVAVMKDNVEEMNAQGVRVPVLLGGAALTRDYAEETLAGLYKGPLLYCKDAFDGLHAMDAIAGGQIGKAVLTQRERAEKRRRLRESAVKPSSYDAAETAKIAKDNPVPAPPFWGRRVVSDLPVREVFAYINEVALFRGQWGYKQGKLSSEEFERSIEESARPVFLDLQRRAEAEEFLQPRVVYGYFPVQSSGNDLIVYHVEEFERGKLTPKGKASEWLRFRFPRQEGRRRLCISDFFRSVQGGEYDVLGVQLVTVGSEATALAEKLRRENRYQDYLYLHGFGVESAEGLAELWHRRMRAELGFAAEDAPTIRELFQQRYRGSRYSFGYPACPNLEDRAMIVELLRPAEIGVSLTENFMLVPEQSTDAIVAHHPRAKYFDV